MEKSEMMMSDMDPAGRAWKFRGFALDNDNCFRILNDSEISFIDFLVKEKFINKNLFFFLFLYYIIFCITTL